MGVSSLNFHPASPKAGSAIYWSLRTVSPPGDPTPPCIIFSAEGVPYLFEGSSLPNLVNVLCHYAWTATPYKDQGLRCVEFSTCYSPHRVTLWRAAEDGTEDLTFGQQIDSWNLLFEEIENAIFVPNPLATRLAVEEIVRSSFPKTAIRFDAAEKNTVQN